MERVLNNSDFLTEFDPEELVGFSVVTAAGDVTGSVSAILKGIANDNLIVQGQSGEILIPIIADVILSIENDSKTIVIEPIEGLLELNVKKPKK